MIRRAVRGRGPARRQFLDECGQLAWVAQPPTLPQELGNATGRAAVHVVAAGTAQGVDGPTTGRQPALAGLGRGCGRRRRRDDRDRGRGAGRSLQGHASRTRPLRQSCRHPRAPPRSQGGQAACQGAVLRRAALFPKYYALASDSRPNPCHSGGSPVSPRHGPIPFSRTRSTRPRNPVTSSAEPGSSASRGWRTTRSTSSCWLRVRQVTPEPLRSHRYSAERSLGGPPLTHHRGRGCTLCLP